MLNKTQIFGAAGLAALLLSGCGASSDEGKKKITFYLPEMGKKLKLL